MAISNHAKPSIRGLRAAFGNATNFKDQHRSVQFLSEQAGRLGRTIQTKARHFGTDFTAAYHAFRASYKDRHLSSYLEQCKADLEAEGFQVDAQSDRAHGFSEAWDRARQEREATEAASTAPEEPAGEELPDEPLRDAPASEHPAPEAPPEPASAAPSDMAAAARSYSEQGINGALMYLVDVLKEYQAAPEDQKGETALGKALEAARTRDLAENRTEPAPAPQPEAVEPSGKTSPMTAEEIEKMVADGGVVPPPEATGDRELSDEDIRRMLSGEKPMGRGEEDAARLTSNLEGGGKEQEGMGLS